MTPPDSAVGSADASTFLGAGVSPLGARVSAPAFAIPVSDNVLNGIGFIVGATLFFSIGDVVAKMMTATVPAVEVTWFRYLVFMLLVVPAGLLAKGRQAFATERPGLQAFRGFGVATSSILFVLGLAFLQPAEATAINFVSPIFITALSIPFLGEKVGVHRWGAAAVGFLGVMLLVRPGSDAFQAAALLPIGAAVAWAGATVATRKMTGERPEVTLAWTALMGFACVSALVVFEWNTPSAHEIGLGILTGLFTTAGHVCVVRAYRLAPASVLAPFSYVQLIFAGIVGFVALGLIPGAWTLAGGAVIAASGLYTAHRERVRARPASRAV